MQVSPLQSGHLQTSQPQLAFASMELDEQQLTLALAEQQLGAALAAVLQAHSPHSQSSQVQVSPLQSGHLQSTQPQDDFA